LYPFRGTKTLKRKNKVKTWAFQSFCIFIVWTAIPCPASASVSWDDVFYSTGQYRGSNKIGWSKMTEEQRAFYLERYKNDIDYCLKNWGKRAKDIDSEKRCCTSGKNPPVSYYMIALKYMNYGDHIKEAEYYHKDWLDSMSNPNWEPFSGDADEIDVVISGYEFAGMYKEALPFYEKAYAKFMERAKISTDVKLLKSNFKEYKKNWPGVAEDYLSFMRDWNKAKKLSKTEKPKPLEPAVQNHKWFYSDKQEEVLKALEFYSQNKVKFMLEKDLNHKDPVVAAKAKEYLESLTKGASDETKH
jgi:hypothetical protein